MEELHTLTKLHKTKLNDSEHKNFLIKKCEFLNKLIENMDNDVFNNDSFARVFFKDDETDYVSLLTSSDSYEECVFYDAIYFFEDKKNMYRCKYKEYFEYYDKLQELFYIKMELIYPNEKDEVVADRWDKSIEEVSKE
jgi:hypothetical protein